MGTNYYWYPLGAKDCPHCHRPAENLHIGKSSGGWCFSLRIHPEKGIHTLADRRERWTTGEICDENDNDMSVVEMLRIITERTAVDPGREFSRAFLYQNHAKPGPNGLLRAGGDGAWSRDQDVKAGDGTYDLINYEFS